MKRIEVAYPFEAARGALGGKQKLVYNDHNNPAFDAPLGRQYAKNYRKQMIASKRASDGLNYFQIKSRSAVNNTVQGLVRQAAFAVANLMFAQVLNDKTVGGLLDRMQQALADTIERGYLPADTTLRQHFVGEVYKKLIAHQDSFGFGMAWSGHSSVIIFANPYCYKNSWTGTDTWVKLTIPADMLTKFWLQLGFSDDAAYGSPKYFTVNGGKGLTFDNGIYFQTLAGMSEPNYQGFSNLNVLDIEEKTVEGQQDGMAVIGTQFILDGATYVTIDEQAVAGKKYTTTAVEPA